MVNLSCFNYEKPQKNKHFQVIFHDFGPKNGWNMQHLTQQLIQTRSVLYHEAKLKLRWRWNFDDLVSNCATSSRCDRGETLSMFSAGCAFWCRRSWFIHFNRSDRNSLRRTLNISKVYVSVEAGDSLTEASYWWSALLSHCERSLCLCALHVFHFHPQRRVCIFSGRLTTCSFFLNQLIK